VAIIKPDRPAPMMMMIFVLFMRYSSFWNLLFFTSLIGFPPTTTTISPLGAVFQNG
jgi:hypothetical protein